MADPFIDQEETQIYGPYASRMIRKLVVGLIPELDAGLNYSANRIDAATEAVAETLTAAQELDATRRQAVRNKRPMLRQARNLLTRFSRHLQAHAEGSVDRKVFFKADGTASGVGQSAAAVLQALTHISLKLKERTEINDRERWQSEFERVMSELAPVVDNAADARTDRRLVTPESEAARAAWHQAYLAARSMVEGVLRESGRLGLLSTVFHDLAVPAGTKLTQAIPDPPPQPDESHDDDDES